MDYYLSENINKNNISKKPHTIINFVLLVIIVNHIYNMKYEVEFLFCGDIKNLNSMNKYTFYSIY